MKLSALILPIVSVVLLVLFSQQQSIPVPITALNSSIFLLIFSGIVSLMYVTLVLSVVYPPLMIAADPQLDNISSRYPLFPSSTANGGWLSAEAKKSINLTILGGFTTIFLIPLAVLLSLIAHDQKVFNVYMNLCFFTVIEIHAILIGRKSTFGYIASVIPIIANVFLFAGFFVLFMLFSKVSVQYAQFNEYVLAAFCYVLILISISVVCRRGTRGALLWGAVLLGFFCTPLVLANLPPLLCAF